MATMFHRICLEDYTITDEEGTSFTLKRGKEYTTTCQTHGTVLVCSRYWVRVPVSLFGGDRQFVGPKERDGLPEAVDAVGQRSESPICPGTTAGDPR